MNHSSPRRSADCHSEYAPLSSMMKGGNRLHRLHIVGAVERDAHSAACADRDKRGAGRHGCAVVDDRHCHTPQTHTATVAMIAMTSAVSVQFQASGRNGGRSLSIGPWV